MIFKVVKSLLIIVCFAVRILAQQDAQFSQYLFAQNVLNPSLSGLELNPSVQFLYRSQYLGYTGSFDNTGTLNTQLVNVQMPLQKLKAGIGFTAINDVVAAQSNQNVKISFAKILKVNSGILSVGLSAGVFNKTIKDELRPRESGDNIIPVGQSQLKPDFGIGVNYKTQQYFIGLAINHLNNPKFDYGTNEGKSILYKTISSLIGVNLQINNELVITPTILIRNSLQTLTYDTGIVGYYKNKYWVGSNFRNQDALTLLAGSHFLKENKLKIGLAYDLVSSNQKVKSPSSAEIFVSYNFNSNSKNAALPIKKPIIRTPRYRH
jgi:type IX secretion system PorP/SprF family membrane protein